MFYPSLLHVLKHISKVLRLLGDSQIFLGPVTKLSGLLSGVLCLAFRIWHFRYFTILLLLFLLRSIGIVGKKSHIVWFWFLRVMTLPEIALWTALGIPQEVKAVGFASCYGLINVHQQRLSKGFYQLVNRYCNESWRPQVLSKS